MLAVAVGYLDIWATLGGITIDQTGRALECAMLPYLLASFALSAVTNLSNRSVAIPER